MGATTTASTTVSAFPRLLVGRHLLGVLTDASLNS